MSDEMIDAVLIIVCVSALILGFTFILGKFK